VDTAIWDAVGRALGVSLHRLWGGYRDSVPVITIGGYYSPDADIAAEVSGLVEAGFAGMKFKVGGMTPEEDAVRLREARRVAGPEFKLAVDANQGWRPEQAIRFSKMVADCDLLWFEEPCQWQNDRRAMRDVRLAAGVPLCAGQSEFSAAGCRDLMETGSIDFCNFDSSWSGGPTEWRRAAAMATVYDVRMAHHEEPQVAAHLLASIPHGTYLEYFHPMRDPIWHGLIANRPQLVDGRITLPGRPGLGWELDQDYIDRYAITFD
jgi:L-alanine-DL-glutamate epimerase-like enolase superfamily enzyme